MLGTRIYARLAFLIALALVHCGAMTHRAGRQRSETVAAPVQAAPEARRNHLRKLQRKQLR